MARLSGRAPNCGSKPSLAINCLAERSTSRRELLLRQALLQPLQLDVHDARQVLLVEAVEDDDVVHAVEELGPEMRLQLGFTSRSSLRVVLHARPCRRCKTPG